MDRLSRGLFYAGCTVAFLIVLGLLLSAGPHTSPGVTIVDSTATVHAGETLVVQTFDIKQYASLVREGSNVVVIGMFSARYPTKLCGTGCSVSVNAVSFYNVTVTELDNDALQVEWSWPVKLR